MKEYFVDQIFGEEHAVTLFPHMVSFGMKDASLIVRYLGKESLLSLDELDLKPIHSLTPNYMMEPNITLKSVG